MLNARMAAIGWFTLVQFNWLTFTEIMFYSRRIDMMCAALLGEARLTKRICRADYYMNSLKTCMCQP